MLEHTRVLGVSHVLSFGGVVGVYCNGLKGCPSTMTWKVTPQTPLSPAAHVVLMLGSPSWTPNEAWSKHGSNSWITSEIHTSIIVNWGEHFQLATRQLAPLGFCWEGWHQCCWPAGILSCCLGRQEFGQTKWMRGGILGKETVNERKKYYRGMRYRRRFRDAVKSSIGVPPSSFAWK